MYFAGQQLEGRLDLTAVVVQRVRAGGLEPCGAHEVGHQHAIDVVAVLFGFAGVADIVGVEPAGAGGELVEDVRLMSESASISSSRGMTRRRTP